MTLWRRTVADWIRQWYRPQPLLYQQWLAALAKKNDDDKNKGDHPRVVELAGFKVRATAATDRARQRAS